MKATTPPSRTTMAMNTLMRPKRDPLRRLRGLDIEGLSYARLRRVAAVISKLGSVDGERNLAILVEEFERRLVVLRHFEGRARAPRAVRQVDERRVIEA